MHAAWNAILKAGGDKSLTKIMVTTAAAVRSGPYCVAALRETSIMFGALIAGVLLKEPVGARRVIAAGAAILRLA